MFYHDGLDIFIIATMLIVPEGFFHYSVFGPYVTTSRHLEKVSVPCVTIWSPGRYDPLCVQLVCPRLLTVSGPLGNYEVATVKCACACQSVAKLKLCFTYFPQYSPTLEWKKFFLKTLPLKEPFSSYLFCLNRNSK